MSLHTRPTKIEKYKFKKLNAKEQEELLIKKGPKAYKDYWDRYWERKIKVGKILNNASLVIALIALVISILKLIMR